MHESLEDFCCFFTNGGKNSSNVANCIEGDHIFLQSSPKRIIDGATQIKMGINQTIHYKSFCTSKALKTFRMSIYLDEVLWLLLLEKPMFSL